MGSPCHAMLLRSGKVPWRRCSEGERAAGQSLKPQRLEPSLVVRVNLCQGAPGPDGRLSSLDPQPVGLGQDYAVSFLPLHTTPVHLVCTSSPQMKKKAQTRLVAGPRSHSTQLVRSLPTFNTPNLGPLHTLTQEMKESSSTSWHTNPSAASTYLRGNMQTGCISQQHLLNAYPSQHPSVTFK